MISLGTLGTSTFDRSVSTALAVSADGSIVVGWTTVDSSPDVAAFIWDEVGGMKNLKEVLENDYGLDLTGWTLGGVVSGATGISADGLTITGRGRNPNGDTEAWIAVLCDDSDLNRDCTVNQLDLNLFTGQWLDTLGDNLPTSNLVAHWKLDESSGTTATDAGGSHHGALTNFPGDDSQWTSGRLGGALQFDGVDDAVEITGYPGVTGTQSRTVAAWIKADDDRAIIAWGQSSGVGDLWQVRLFDNGVNNVLRLAVSGGNINGSTELADNQWHHVAVTWSNDGTPDVIDAKLYVDGIGEVISSSTSQTINTPVNSDVMLGLAINGTIPFSGQMDDVRIYDRALTAGEIQLTADLNGDGRVNYQDWSLFQQFWP